MFLMGKFLAAFLVLRLAQFSGRIPLLVIPPHQSPFLLILVPGGREFPYLRLVAANLSWFTPQLPRRQLR